MNETWQERFCAGLDQQPEDWTLRLVYADWLEEQGQDDLSFCQRWMAAHRVAPSVAPWLPTGDWWGYGSAGRTGEPPDSRCARQPDAPCWVVPEAIWKVIHGDRWNSRREAEEALSVALAELRGMLALNDWGENHGPEGDATFRSVAAPPGAAAAAAVGPPDGAAAGHQPDDGAEVRAAEAGPGG